MNKNDLLLIEFERYLIRKYGTFQKEVVFSKIMDTSRRFRADYLITEPPTIIEINGGEWVSGRHNRGSSYGEDLMKSNIANINGFCYLQFTYTHLKNLDYMKIL